MIWLQAVDGDLQESGWKNLTRVNEEATACSVTAEISGVIYMNLMLCWRGWFFWVSFLFCFKSRGCTMRPGRKEGRQAERMGGKEAENMFSVEMVCVPQPAKLKKKPCVVYLSVAFDGKYFISSSTFEEGSWTQRMPFLFMKGRMSFKLIHLTW